jgi:hypothetical protein
VAGGADAIAKHDADFKRDRALYYGLVSETDAHLGKWRGKLPSLTRFLR